MLYARFLTWNGKEKTELSTRGTEDPGGSHAFNFVRSRGPRWAPLRHPRVRLHPCRVQALPLRRKASIRSRPCIAVPTNTVRITTAGDTAATAASTSASTNGKADGSTGAGTRNGKA